MDDKTNQAPEQSGMPDNEEYSSYTLPTEDAAAQEAHTIPLEDAAAQESRTIPLEDERTQGAQDSAAQPAKKKSPLPWIIGGAAVVIAAAITSQRDKAKLPTHIEIDAARSGLSKNSVVLLEQIRTIDKRRLKERMGEVEPALMNRINSALSISFGLPTDGRGSAT